MGATLAAKNRRDSRSRCLRFESLEERQLLSASGAGADDPLRITSISPTLDQGPIPFISSLEVTFNKAIDQTTFSPEDVAVVDLDRFKMTGVSAFDGMMYDTVAEGSLLYAATDAGLEIFDISDPSQVRQLGVY